MKDLLRERVDFFVFVQKHIAVKVALSLTVTARLIYHVLNSLSASPLSGRSDGRVPIRMK